MSLIIDLNEDAFVALFKPQPNHLNPNAGWRFETFGPEVEHIRRQPERTVWTLVDADGEFHWLSGCHLANRLGYAVCAVPVPDGVAVQVCLHDDASARREPEFPRNHLMTDTTNTSTLRDQANALLNRLRTTKDDEEPYFDVTLFAHQLLAARQQIAAIWSIEDVQGLRPDLTAEQAWDVLHEVGRKHNAEYGISWTTLTEMAYELCGRAPATNDSREK